MVAYIKQLTGHHKQYVNVTCKLFTLKDTQQDIVGHVRQKFEAVDDWANEVVIFLYLR